MNSQTGTLFIVATPIGNLADISGRAIKILSEVSIILSEDTRHTAKLLSAYNITTPTSSCHAHNEREITAQVIRRLQAGQNIALVSDAGTPLISDPGYLLVQSAIKHGIRISPIPGPSALIAALSVAGVPTDRFCFEGFLPSRHHQRCLKLEKIRWEPRTMIFYESSHRILASLKDMAEIFGDDKEAVIGREITKIHETFYCSTLGDICDFVSDNKNQQKGEFVILVKGDPAIDKTWKQACVLADRLSEVLPAKKASRIAADTFEVSRNRLYQYIIQASDTSDK